MKSVSAWVATHAPTGTRWGKRTLALLLSLVLCLTLLPGAAFAAGDTSGHWAEKTITDWQQKGYISGYGDGSFRPDSSITRAEFIKILNRVLGLTAEGSISFSDVRESDWFYAEVAKAVAAGYAQGSADGTFRPNAPITRAEAAAMLARAFKLTENEARAAQFTDAASIPAWAKGSVGAVAEAGYMTGYPDGSFGANGSITRAEAVVTADRAERAAAEDTKKPTTPGTTPGGTVTPPAQQKTVTGVQTTVNDITVDYGTRAEDVIKMLPQKVTLTCKDGTTVEANVTWPLDGYSATPNTTTDYTATGTVAIPDGYTYNGTLTVTAKLTVRGGDKTIQSVVQPTGIEVNCNTSETDAMARLSTEATLNLYADGVTFGAVTWTRTSAEYTQKPTGKAAVMTYTGTVTIPDGYVYKKDPTSKTVTIETTIKVLPSGQDAAPKYIVGDPPSISVDVKQYIYPGENGAALKRFLPQEIRLYCEDGSPVTVTAVQEKWTPNSDPTFDTKDGYSVHTFKYSFADIMTLPSGYQFQSGLNQGATTVTAYVYLKNRDGAKLEEAIKDLQELKSQFTTSELEALEDPNKIYQAPDKTEPGVAKGVKFVTRDIIDELKRNIEDATDNYLNNGEKSQKEIDAKTIELTNLKGKIDALTWQTGTGFTDANILYNVKEALKTKAAWLTSDEPLKAEEQSTYTLPLTLTDVVTDANDGKSTVSLMWSCNCDKITINNDNNDGSLTITAPTTPQKITFTASVKNAADDEKIGTLSFDALLGAPISVDPSKQEVPTKLTSGQTNENFMVKIPLRAIGSAAEERQNIENIVLTEITATCADNSLTDFTSIKIDPPHDQASNNRDGSYLDVYMTATANQLPAKVASADSTTHYETATVTFTIPSNAITLTQDAIDAGWYIPKDGLALQGKVKIWHPLVEIKQPTLDGNDVYIVFNTEHWSSSYKPTVWMALVSDAESAVASNAPKGNRVITGGNGKYDLRISASNLTAGTTYNVWVKVGDDGAWMKSTTTYTHSPT